MMTAPVLFLDVDGVLNHRGVFSPDIGPDPLCPKAVDRLCKMVSATGSKVVLSSTWRLGGKASRHVRKLQMSGVLDSAHGDWRTVDLPCKFVNGLVIVDDPRRGREIAEWLSRHPEVTTYAIVDDDGDMLPEQAKVFVQTSFDTGLLDEHVEQLTAILNDRP